MPCPGTSRVVKLGEDMISLAGTPVTIEAPYLFEDSGINKIGDTYYYTYCSNWKTSGNSYGMTSGAIEYMTASNPLGPYTYGGNCSKIRVHSSDCTATIIIPSAR